MDLIRKNIIASSLITLMGFALFIYSTFFKEELNKWLFIVSLIIILVGCYYILTGDSNKQSSESGN